MSEGHIISDSDRLAVHALVVFRRAERTIRSHEGDAL